MIFSNFKELFSRLQNKKHHIDFIVAILTVPVLLTVILTNILNLQKNGKSNIQPTPPPGKEIIIQTVPSDSQSKVQPVKTAITPIANCKKTVGPISISYPSEGETVSDNPVCITIKYDDPNYCSVVWSYRINNNTWSDYSNNSACLYNLSKGEVKFDLRIQSTVSQDQTKSLSRTFNYQGTSEENVASPSAK